MNRSKLFAIGFASAMIQCNFVQAEESFIDHYKTSQSALSEGDFAAGVEHSIRAWEASRDQNASLENQIKLAQNAAINSFLYGDNEGLDAAKHAIQLAQQGIVADYSVLGIEMLVSAFEIRKSPEMRNFLLFTEKWSSFVEDESSGHFLISELGMDISVRAIATKDWNLIADITGPFAKYYATLDQTDPRGRAAAYLLHARTLTNLPVDPLNLENAAILLSNAEMEFDGMINIDSLDPNLQQIMLLGGTIPTSITKQLESSQKIGIFGLEYQPVTPASFHSAFDSPACNITSIRKPNPIGWDRAIRDDNFFDIVIVGFRWDPNGKAADVRLIRSLSGSPIVSKSAIRAVQKWKAEIPAEVPAECLTNRLTSFTFRVAPE